MPVIADPPVSPPLVPPAEDASNLWEIIYEAMGFHRDDDPATGYQLRKLIEGLCNPYQDIYDLLREREGQKGWAILFDPDECPARWLPYLAQYVGFVIEPQMSEAQIRAEIKKPTTWRRGQPEAIKLATRRTLKPIKEGEELRVIIRARTPEAGCHYVRTLLSQTPDPERTGRVVRENVAAWELLDYAAIDAVSYADMEAAWDLYADEEAAFTSYAKEEDILPTELP